MLPFQYIYIWKTGSMESGNFPLFAANGNGKLQFFFLTED
jgi:hypothetical protein